MQSPLLSVVTEYCQKVVDSASYTEYASYKYLVHIMDGIAIIPRSLLPGNEVGLLCIIYTLLFQLLFVHCSNPF